MRNQEYCEEIRMLLYQFISAIDDCTIIRENEEKKEYLRPAFTLNGVAPVWHDLINQAKSVTLPIVVVEPKGIKLDEKRMFNKTLQQRVAHNGNVYFYKQPTPITISVNMTCFTTFYNDLFQLFSNFSAYMQPYFFISTQVPTEFKDSSEECRTKVTWDGSFDISRPENFNGEEHWLIKGTASFTLEGWIFEKKIGNDSHTLKIVHK